MRVLGQEVMRVSGLIRVGQATRKLGVHRSTIVRWERDGRISPLRGPGGVRFYRSEDIERLREWMKPKASQGGKETAA